MSWFGPTVVVAYLCQVGIVALGAGVAVTASGIRAPRILLAHYQGALAAALVLPWLLAASAAPRITASLALPMIGVGLPADHGAPVSVHTWAVVAVGLAIGACLRLSWIIVGVVRLRFYGRAASELSPLPPAIAEAERVMGVRARWCLSNRVPGPATFGVWRPVVLLPARQGPASIAEQRMIAIHELVHVARRDWLFVVTEEVIRAVFWFHPGIWFLLDRIALHREQVVDERVIAVTGSPQSYGEALLNGLERGGLPQPRPAAMWRQARHLRARIRRIARGRPVSPPAVARSAVVLASVVVLSSVWAACAFPVRPQQVYEGDDRGVTLPQAATEAKPLYTREAMEAGIQGTLMLAAVVEPDGTVGDVRVTRSLDATYGLDDAGVKAAKRWQFRPGTKGGDPVAVRVALEFRFALR